MSRYLHNLIIRIFQRIVTLSTDPTIFSAQTFIGNFTQPNSNRGKARQRDVYQSTHLKLNCNDG